MINLAGAVMPLRDGEALIFEPEGPSSACVVVFSTPAALEHAAEVFPEVAGFDSVMRLRDPAACVSSFHEAGLEVAVDLRRDDCGKVRYQLLDRPAVTVAGRSRMPLSARPSRQVRTPRPRKGR